MRRLTCVVLAGLVASSCAKRETNQAVRLGLIPSENLSGDPSLDWISQAVPVLLAAQLEGLPGVTIVRAGSRRDTASGGAAAILCRHESSSAKLRLTCWKDGSSSIVQAEGSLGDGLTTLVTQVGQGLYSGARPAPEIGDRVLRAYASKEFLEAARLAPDFGYAYTDGAVEALTKGDRAGADRLIADGLARGSGIGDIARARLYLLNGTLSQHRGDQISALRQLTALVPTEPDYWQRLAQSLSAGKQFADAAAAQERLSVLSAADPAVWNQLAYLRAWSGDFAGAKAAVARYEQLAPGAANAADTLGDVHFHAGEFAEAEKQYLESMIREPDFMGGQGYFKAAMARLRSGDQTKAEEHFREFAEKAGPEKDFLLAQWRYITGDDGTAEMERVSKSAEPDMVATALAQLAVWRCVEGAGDKANALARQSLTLSKSPLARRSAQTAFFLTLPRTDAAGWRDRTEKALPGPALERARRGLALNALVAQGDYSEALPLAKKMFDDLSSGEDFATRIFLAWCLFQTGDTAGAAELLRTNPIPIAPVSGPFDSVLLRQELKMRTALKD